jgi:hypothetical protein
VSSGKVKKLSRKKEVDNEDALRIIDHITKENYMGLCISMGTECGCGAEICEENTVHEECNDNCEICDYCGCDKCKVCGAHLHCGGCV